MTTPRPRRLALLSVLTAFLLLVGFALAARPAPVLAADGELRWIDDLAFIWGVGPRIEDLELKAR